MKIKDVLQIYQTRVNQKLKHWLPSETQIPKKLHQAMHYSLFNGGKRLRPALVYATAEALKINLDQVDASAVAIELIHTYSLVHDDLPAMDNDDFRRGVATCHKAFDEATAILVGDALQSLAFYVLAQENSELNARKHLQMAQCLAYASGSRGMAGGQAMDLENLSHTTELNTLEKTFELKTGALISASVKLAILATDTDFAHEKALLDYADAIGLAFQIQDDILDEENQTDGIDQANPAGSIEKKASYPELAGMTQAKTKLAKLIASANQALDIFDSQADPLRNISQYIISREF